MKHLQKLSINTSIALCFPWSLVKTKATMIRHTLSFLRLFGEAINIGSGLMLKGKWVLRLVIRWKHMKEHWTLYYNTELFWKPDPRSRSHRYNLRDLWAIERGSEQLLCRRRFYADQVGIGMFCRKDIWNYSLTVNFQCCLLRSETDIQPFICKHK